MRRSLLDEGRALDGMSLSPLHPVHLRDEVVHRRHLVHGEAGALGAQDPGHLATGVVRHPLVVHERRHRPRPVLVAVEPGPAGDVAVVVAGLEGGVEGVHAGVGHALQGRLGRHPQRAGGAGVRPLGGALAVDEHVHLRHLATGLLTEVDGCQGVTPERAGGAGDLAGDESSAKLVGVTGTGHVGGVLSLLVPGVLAPLLLLTLGLAAHVSPPGQALWCRPMAWEMASHLSAAEAP